MKVINQDHFNFKDRTGEKFTTNENHIVTIIKYKSYHKCDIIFEDNTILENVSLNMLRKGKIFKPKNRVGEKYISNEGFDIEIIKYEGCDNCTILFNNEEVRENILYNSVKHGKVKNYIFPQIYGVGYLGRGLYNANHKIANKLLYTSWMSTLSRCYGEKSQEKQPTYKGVTVCEEWHNFQNYAKWYEENYNPEFMEGWELDKDVLIKGNKIYSPDTCCFIPKEINTLFTKRQNKRGNYPIGVIKKLNRFQAIMAESNSTVNLGSFKTSEEAFRAYKTAKEDYIKRVADKWKDLIDPRVYEAMYKYEVEITD